MFKWKLVLIIFMLGFVGLSDPVFARFVSVDPIGAAQYIKQGNVHGFNRYTYGNNNPYKYVDPDGRVAETVWDAANVTMGVASMGNNISSGNYGAAGIDAVGVAIDGVATVVPFIPGGAGMAIKVTRGTEPVFKTSKEAAQQ
ncbi:hypothetical protein TUM4438_41410 [Shewanella sairae]|uniref:Novel toxin 10 domain-containing protein n=1 Tax=Shewanella sairae TaxID=190310 RepID=A0ABQ4PQN0_9GAMM|nr:polymorphic toxin type 10 domain-containing protein [Shewanella sairae]MCL1132345.1 polymorphic toxin type 10 domain-containing protein [Shewanella sairae]GIU51514.1 hypothetical protein TUM4438_41410 [Shewanella sairae]